MIFLLVKEEELKEYLRIQTLRATMFWGSLADRFSSLIPPFGSGHGLIWSSCNFLLGFSLSYESFGFSMEGEKILSPGRFELDPND